MRQITILWTADKPAKEFAVQTWDGKAWQEQKSVTGNKDPRSTLELGAPVTTRAVRIRITAPVADNAGIAEISIR